MADKPVLTGLDQERYLRQILIPSFGEDGQNRLKNSSVVIIGAGGLGSPVLQYLAAAGIGNIGILDNDEVQLSNLNRQTLYKPQDIGQSKAILAASWGANFNPFIRIDPLPVRLESINIHSLLEPYPVLIDTTDNFVTRYILSDYAFQTGKPLFFGAINGFSGICTTFIPGETGCLRCLYPNEPSESYQNQEKSLGVIGFLPGIIGSIMAGNVIKFILQQGDYMKNQLFTLDGKDNITHFFHFSVRTNCKHHL